jgi:hypothetical protein
MKRLAALAALTIYGLIGYEIGALAEDQFKKLSGTQIRAKFTGMEFTDQVHWGEVYGSDGKLKSEEMGTKRTGTLAHPKRPVVYRLWEGGRIELL